MRKENIISDKVLKVIVSFFILLILLTLSRCGNDKLDQSTKERKAFAKKVSSELSSQGFDGKLTVNDTDLTLKIDVADYYDGKMNDAVKSAIIENYKQSFTDKSAFINNYIKNLEKDLDVNDINIHVDVLYGKDKLTEYDY